VERVKTKLSYFLFLIILLAASSCNTTEPPPPDGDKPTLLLKLEDVSCTEAWIELTTTNLQLPATITLKQINPTGDTLSQVSILNTKDSLLYIDSLLPNKSYQYQVSSIENLATSNELNVTTMDTTSHSLTWQVFTFGEHSHSRLNDVAIVGNEIWAVGEIYMNDSLGNPDPNAYNAVHWDGSHWELKRLLYQGGFWVIRSIFAFNENDIWFSAFIRYDGQNFIELPIPPILIGWSINKIWGSNSSDLYVVGNNGNIAWYNGSQWSRIESGTDVDLLDVWGTPDGTVWACGYSGDYAISALLKITGQSVEKIYEGFSSNQNNGYYVGPMSGEWGTGNIRIYLMNWSGIYIQANSSNLFLEKEIAKFSDVGFGIDGTDDNNIFSCGEGFVGHWNGTNYTEYPELFKSSRTFLNVSAKRNTVAAVGSDYNSLIYSQAVIAVAK
jgi:hypothetical protein